MPSTRKFSPPKIVWANSLNPPKSASRTPFLQKIAKAEEKQIHPTSACCGARAPPRPPPRHGGVCSRYRHRSTRCSRTPRSSAAIASRASPMFPQFPQLLVVLSLELWRAPLLLLRLQRPLHLELLPPPSIAVLIQPPFSRHLLHCATLELRLVHRAEELQAVLSRHIPEILPLKHRGAARQPRHRRGNDVCRSVMTGRTTRWRDSMDLRLRTPSLARGLVRGLIFRIFVVRSRHVQHRCRLLAVGAPEEVASFRYEGRHGRGRRRDRDGRAQECARARAGGGRARRGGREREFELTEQSVTVKNWNFLNEKRDFELPPASDGFDPGAEI